MKKFLCLLLALAMLLSSTACVGKENESSEDESTNSNTQKEYDITDYSVEPLRNVSSVHFSVLEGEQMHEVDPKETKPTHLVIYTKCPVCNDIGDWVVEVGELADCPFGKLAFIWSKQYQCDKWYTHSDPVVYTFDFSLIFIKGGQQSVEDPDF